MHIPKTIHQIWYSNEPMPKLFEVTNSSWRKHNTTYSYKLWLKTEIDDLVDKFEEVKTAFNNRLYDIQKIDIVKYLILYTYGGVYVDIDYECLKPISDLINKKSLCLSYEPESHSALFNNKPVIGNAFLGANQSSLFMQKLINTSLINISKATISEDAVDGKFMHILQTTGPHMLTRVANDTFCESDFDDSSMSIVSSEVLAPLSKNEAFQYINGNINAENLRIIKKAHAIHYFMGSWINSL